LLPFDDPRRLQANEKALRQMQQREREAGPVCRPKVKEENRP
jgi:hypothetical protein